MKRLFVMSVCVGTGWFLLTGCEKDREASAAASSYGEQPAPPAALVEPVEPAQAVVRIHSTIQSWNLSQPWEKDPPLRRSALGALVAPRQVITTAEMVADASYVEFESIDGNQLAPARVLAIDYEANLALLTCEEEPSSLGLFDLTRPLETASPPAIGDSFSLIQADTNGSLLATTGKLQSVDLTSPMVAAGGFLTYKIKASMQNAASSFSLPVLREGKLAGILFRYDAKDQLCEVGSTEILTRFIQSAASGTGSGFPSLGVSISHTEDPSFRQWLALPEEAGGLYIHAIRKGSAAEDSGLRKGDVLLAIDDLPIDRRGYIRHPVYGNLLWGHWIRGTRSTGDSVRLTLWRDGQRSEQTVVLTREDESKRIVPLHTFGRAPHYLVKGGLIFQELSLPMLQSFGKDWQRNAPLDLLNAYENPESFENSVDRIVFLSGVIPTPATVGYEQLRYLMVRQVNGHPIRDIATLIAAFKSHDPPFHSIEFAEESLTIYLDERLSSEMDRQLLQRGLHQLSRTGDTP